MQTRLHQAMPLAPATVQFTAPKELRPLVHSELDKLPDAYLAAARQLILEMQMQHVLEELDKATDKARIEGRLTPERIARAIKEHRALHPYR